MNRANSKKVGRAIADAMLATVKVVQDETASVEKEILAKSIVDASVSLQRLLKSGLNHPPRKILDSAVLQESG